MKGCTDLPKTIGEHIRKRRIELGLEQTELARSLGVHRGSVQLWEQNRGTPMPRRIPGIIRFLGYVPLPQGDRFGTQLAFLRQCAGLTQTDLSSQAGCSADLIGRWERGKSPPRKANLVRVLEILSNSVHTRGIETIIEPFDLASLTSMSMSPVFCSGRRRRGFDCSARSARKPPKAHKAGSRC
jgi:transcriptional regulator with XRE-family HTH domain